VTLNEAIYALCSTDAAVSLAVAEINGGFRAYPITAPQGSGRPYLTWQRITSSPTYAQTGGRGLTKDTVQFDIWADDPDTSRALAGALKDALDAWTAVQRSFVRDDSEFYEPDTKLYRVSIDSDIWSTLL
jgi:hypothetical protein